VKHALANFRPISSRPPKHPARSALHRTVADAVQEFLAGVSGTKCAFVTPAALS
jgi:hypothetical protein